MTLEQHVENLLTIITSSDYFSSSDERASLEGIRRDLIKSLLVSSGCRGEEALKLSIELNASLLFILAKKSLESNSFAE